VRNIRCYVHRTYERGVQEVHRTRARKVLGSTKVKVPGPDLPIGYISLSLGPQDPWGLPANCGTHGANCWYTISSISIPENLWFNYSRNLILFSQRFLVDNARVFQRVSMNLNKAVGEAAC